MTPRYPPPNPPLNPDLQEEKYKKELKGNFSAVVFLIFSPLDAGFVILDLKFGIYVKFPPRNRLERSRIWNAGPKMKKVIVLYVFVVR